MWIGEAIWLCLAASGASFIAQSFYSVFVILKYLGVAYLLYLAWKMWTAPAVVNEGDLPTEDLPWRLFATGMAITLGNPKIMVFYLAILPSLIDLSGITVLGIAELVAVLMVVLISVDLTWVAIAAQARRWLRSFAGHAHRQSGERHRHGRRSNRDCDEMIRAQSKCKCAFLSRSRERERGPLRSNGKGEGTHRNHPAHLPHVTPCHGSPSSPASGRRHNRQYENSRETTGMSELAKYAKDRNIKFFLFNFTDLFGTQRAKLVPARGGRQDAEGGRGLCGLCHLARPDAGASRHPRHARSQCDHSFAVAARCRLGGGRSVDGRQAAGAGAAPGA